jgi:hemolysin activation/secretion protein
VKRGAGAYALAWSVPLNRHDTTLTLGLERTGSAVVSEPFNVLDIESELVTHRVALSHPLVLTRSREIGLSLSLEREENRTSLLGVPFSFSPGARDGRAAVTALRFGQSWVERAPERVVAFSSTLSLGLGLLGSSVGAGVPDSRFLTWLGQAQWFERLAFLDSRVLLRLGVQLANDALLPSEKFVVGGFDTVRGYRENQLVRDNALLASLEWRVPIGRLPYPGLGEGPEDGEIFLVPFLDYGRAWESGAQTPQPPDIASVGAGLAWLLSSRVEAGLYWGRRLRAVTDSGDNDLQDEGVHFHLRASY